MRVIAGEYKGRPLKALSGSMTRPTGDKIKESLFQQIGPFFRGGKCLDLYAGSGALGIEALSRGMDTAVLIDKNPQAIHTIRENINRLKLDDCVQIMRKDATSALKILHGHAETFHVIFLDPPYKEADFQGVIQNILRWGLLAEDGIICCEYGIGHELPDLSDYLSIRKQKTYGTTTGMTIYQNLQ